MHILSEEHATLGAWFAGGRDDKFEGVAYTWSKRGLPLLSDCHTRMECSLEGEHGGGDHVIVVGLVVTAQCSPDLKPLQAIGYREIVQYLQNTLEWEPLLQEIQKRTRQYAKRQMTWFSREAEIEWYQPDDDAAILAKIKVYLEK